MSFASISVSGRVSTTLAVLLFLALAGATPRPALAGKPPQSVSALDSVLQRTDSSQLKGQVIYVDFWASWCAPCQQSFPWMKDLHRQYADKGLTIIAVDLDRKPDDGRAFVDQWRVPFDILIDSVGAFAKAFNIQTMPTSFIYDRTGTLRYRHEGFVPGDTTNLDSLIAACIQEKPKP